MTLRRGAGWGCAVVVVVVAVRLIAGPWVAAAIMAVAAVVGLIAALTALETRVLDRERRSPSVGVVVPERVGPSAVVVSERAGPSPAEHLAYARALAVVVASYVAECEREAGLR